MQSKSSESSAMKIFFGLLLVIFISSATATSEENLSSSSNESSECKIRYKYTLWIGDNIDDVYSIHLNSECGIVFLDAMQQASEKKDEFEFEHTTHPVYGAFITKIAGVANDEEASTYWMIYDLTSKPDVDNVPSDEYLSSVGVSTLEVADGHSYLFWYRTVTWDYD